MPRLLIAIPARHYRISLTFYIFSKSPTTSPIFFSPTVLQHSFINHVLLYQKNKKNKKQKIVQIYVHILAHCNCKAIVPTSIHHFGTSVAQLHTGQHVWQESIDIYTSNGHFRMIL